MVFFTQLALTPFINAREIVPSPLAFMSLSCAILLDKVVQTNIHDTSWLVIRDGLSDSFPLNQGVGRGRILSTGFYKVYIDELLRILKSKKAWPSYWYGIYWMPDMCR